MVSLFFIISLTLAIVVIKKIIKKIQKDKEHYEDGKFAIYFAIAFMAFMSSIGFSIWEFNLINTVATEHIIDEKITMYKEENRLIEESIDVTVNNYMDLSDTLGQEQINVYIANNNKIKQLKEEKIDLSKAKWKLYFGR